MQREPDNDLIKRLVLYLTRMFTRQYKSSKGLNELYPVIVIAIANSIPELQHINRYRSAHFLCDDETHVREIKELGLILIDLSKFDKKEDEVKTNEEKWLLFFKIIGSAETLPAPFQTGEFKEACDLLNLMTKDTMYRMEYENVVTGIESMKHNKQIEREKAEAKAKLEGEAIGERKAKIEFAQRLLAEGMTVDQVAKLTGISIEDIQKL
jgi:predicted transposase/invertase (TIGR01784 family)